MTRTHTTAYTKSPPGFFFVLTSLVAIEKRIDCQCNRCSMCIVGNGFAPATTSHYFQWKDRTYVGDKYIAQYPSASFPLASILWYRVICHIDQFLADVDRITATVHYVALRRCDNATRVIIDTDLSQIFLFSLPVARERSIKMISIIIRTTHEFLRVING